MSCWMHRFTTSGFLPFALVLDFLKASKVIYPDIWNLREFLTNVLSVFLFMIACFFSSAFRTAAGVALCCHVRQMRRPWGANAAETSASVTNRKKSYRRCWEISDMWSIRKTTEVQQNSIWYHVYNVVFLVNRIQSVPLCLFDFCLFCHIAVLWTKRQVILGRHCYWQWWRVLYEEAPLYMYVYVYIRYFLVTYSIPLDNVIYRCFNFSMLCMEVL